MEADTFGAKLLAADDLCPAGELICMIKDHRQRATTAFGFWLFGNFVPAAAVKADSFVTSLRIGEAMLPRAPTRGFVGRAVVEECLKLWPSPESWISDASRHHIRYLANALVLFVGGQNVDPERAGRMAFDMLYIVDRCFGAVDHLPTTPNLSALTEALSIYDAGPRNTPNPRPVADPEAMLISRLHKASLPGGGYVIGQNRRQVSAQLRQSTAENPWFLKMIREQ